MLQVRTRLSCGSQFPIGNIASGVELSNGVDAMGQIIGRDGMRRGEVLALRWRDIDFDKASLRVSQSVEEIAGQAPN